MKFVVQAARLYVRASDRAKSAERKKSKIKMKIKIRNEIKNKSEIKRRTNCRARQASFLLPGNVAASQIFVALQPPHTPIHPLRNEPGPIIRDYFLEIGLTIRCKGYPGPGNERHFVPPQHCKKAPLVMALCQIGFDHGAVVDVLNRILDEL